MAARKTRKEIDEHLFGTDPELLYMASDAQERTASLHGQAAMVVYEELRGLPGDKRFRALHILRHAAKRCPNAAYNLASVMGEWESPVRRRRRGARAISLFGMAAEMGLRRMRNTSETVDEAPIGEYSLRDVVSRALTNIGASVANAGKPADALGYFRKAITVFGDNANAHVCYGNMGVHHWKATGVPPLAGIQEWEKAAELGDDCHESARGCPCRANVIRIFRKLEAAYGIDEAVSWLTTRYPGLSMRKRSDEIATPILRAAEIGAQTGTGWSGRSVQAANVIGGSEILSVMKDSPLEAKVTLAGCVLATLSRLDGAYAACGRIAEAVMSLEHIESLHPFLGDDEWEHVEPPRSLYLLSDDVKDRFRTMAKHLKRQVQDKMPGLTAEEAVKGFLFHVDPAFRNGVFKMIERTLRTTPDNRDVYVPAMEVGAPQGRPN